MPTMKAAVFVEPGKIVLDQKPIPQVGPGDALIKVTTTTICGTDVHILKGEYPVAPGRIVGHEPVGVIEALGPAVTSYVVGQRVIAGAITPCGQCHACLDGHQAQCGGKPIGGWRFGNTIDGCQAEYVLVPNAMANLAPVPDGLSDEQVLMCPDIMSTGFGGAESGGIKIGDSVAVFAQGPIGLCATAGAKLKGATRIIVIDGLPERLEMARRLGADVPIDFRKADPIAEIMRLTEGRGVDVAIEALGTQQTFESCLRVLKAGCALQLGCLFREALAPARCDRSRARRSQDRDDAVPGRQGADAPADERGRGRTGGPQTARHSSLQARSDRAGL